MTLRFIVSVFLFTCIIVPVKQAFSEDVHTADLQTQPQVESHAVILMYHRFGEGTYPTTNIKTEQFIQQLDFFENNGFKVWPLSKIVHHLKNKIQMPDKVLAITIDDAYLSVYQIAYPLMLDRKIPFTLFVASGVVDDNYVAYMDWEQIKDMADHGVELGNHSANHLHLVQNKEKVSNEISSSQLRIVEMTGVEPKLFAYPYGEFDLDVGRQISNLNYTGFGQHSGPVGESSDFRYLPRFPVSEQYADMSALTDKLYSLPMPVLDVKPVDAITNLTRPLMMVTLQRALSGKDTLTCFVSGQGAAQIRWVGESRFTVQAKKPITIRRSRYNCTIKDVKTGRYFWYSHMWLRPDISE